MYWVKGFGWLALSMGLVSLTINLWEINPRTPFLEAVVLVSALGIPVIILAGFISVMCRLEKSQSPQPRS